jgi:hypothetical protein
MYQALLIFVAILVVYSVGFFIWCYLAEKKPIFSKRNARSTSSVICGHVTVLLILIMLAQIGLQFYPSFPGWLTDKTFLLRGQGSLVNVLCIISVLAIGAAETRWIYIDRGLSEPESNDSTT